MGICLDARRRGSPEAITIHSAEMSRIGNSSQRRGAKTISSGAIRHRSQVTPSPSSKPTGSATRLNSQASRPKTRRICRLVAPTARSIPISSVLEAKTPSIAEEMPMQTASSSAPPRMSSMPVNCVYAAISVSAGSTG